MIDPWPRLGIARTDDRRAIRKAYAARLKTIDVEAHPAAFVDLREGLEHALAWAADSQWRAENGLPPAEEMPAGDPATQAWAGPPDGEVALAEGEPQPVPEEQWVDPAGQAPWVPPLPDDGNELYRRFDHLLFGLDGADPDREALFAATRDILAHLADESIDRAARIELWLADSALAALPRSNPILYMLVTHFGWDQAAGRIDQPYVFSEVVRRMEIHLVVDQVSQPSHRLHAAWKELTSTRPKLGPTAFLRRDKVWHLLHAIRTQCPWAEETLQPHRVALWEARLANQSSGRFGLLWAFLGLMAMFAIAKFLVPTPPQPPRQAPYVSTASLSSDAGSDLAGAIQASEGTSIDLAAIERENPAFFRRLTTLWTDTRYAGGTFAELSRDVRADLDQAYADGLRAADGDLLEQHWQLVRDRLVYLRDRPDDCAAFLMGAERDYGFPSDLDRRAAALRATFILYTPATPALGSPDPRVAIPPALFDDARARAGLSESAMRAALAGRGPNRARCPARIALIETALRRAEGRQFLREVVAAG